MKLYIYAAEARVARVSATFKKVSLALARLLKKFRSHKPRLKNFLEIFSQKYEVRILIFFKTFKDGIWYYTISIF